jgi:hypothetical protein
MKRRGGALAQYKEKVLAQRKSQAQLAWAAAAEALGKERETEAQVKGPVAEVQDKGPDAQAQVKDGQEDAQAKQPETGAGANEPQEEQSKVCPHNPTPTPTYAPLLSAPGQDLPRPTSSWGPQ